MYINITIIAYLYIYLFCSIKITPVHCIANRSMAKYKKITMYL